MNLNEIESGEEREDRRWNRVYAVVVIYTAALIIGLWLFSRMFN